MLDPVELAFRLTVIVATLAAGVYCFRLQSFFGGGFVGSDLGLIGKGTVLLVGGEVLQIVGRVTSNYELFWVSDILEVMFFVILMVAVRQFYRTWKIGFSKLEGKPSGPVPVSVLS